MNAIQFINNRQIDLNTIFSVNAQLTTEENYDDVMTALCCALEKQLRAWWDVCTVEHYLKQKTIARNLRWEVTPLDGLDDSESG